MLSVIAICKLIFIFNVVFAFDIENEPLIHQALINHDVKSVSRLLDEGADIEVMNTEGWTPLHFAIRLNKKEMIDLLLERGADPNGVSDDYTYKTPMDCLSLMPDHSPIYQLKLASRLVDSGADINGHAALNLAIAHGANELAEWLLKNGANPNHKPTLSVAAKESPLPLFKQLVEAGANINEYNYYGGPMAMATHQVERLKYLVSKGGDVNESYGDGNRPIHIAAEKGYHDAVRYLIEKGAQLDVRKKEPPFLPIELAVQNGHTDIIRELIAAGAKPSVFVFSALGDVEMLSQNDVKLNEAMLGDRKLSAVHIAAIHRQHHVMEWLLKNGIDPNLGSIVNETALHIAVDNWDFEMISILLKHGADPNIGLKPHMYGFGLRTPLHYALGIQALPGKDLPEESMQVKIIVELLKHGASVQAANEFGQTIAEVVNEQGNERMKALLNQAKKQYY